MHLALSAILVFAATASLAQDAELGDAAVAAGIAVTTSYNINAPMVAKTPSEEAAEDQQYRTQMYKQSAKECADLLASIAASCSITNISVSTQITRQPGVANQIYATGNVSMLIEMK